ncbi:MAG TPA: c-type cytochrome, partial [Verrucomicrobiae bacterium]
GLFLMWPSEYAYLMDHPLFHFLDHLGIALCSVLAVFAAQAYMRGLGWPMLALLIAMDAGAAGGFGASHAPIGLSQTSAETSEMGTEGMGGSTMTGSATNLAQNASLHVLGQRLSQTLGCTACHRVDNAKAVGPSWRNLAGYPQKLSNGATQMADYQFLKNAILYPEHLQLQGFPPGAMPNSYRSLLSGPQHTNGHQLDALIWYINTLSDHSSPATQPPTPDESGK